LEVKNIAYNIGLDIGTTSVGYAVVNRYTNKIIRKNGKSFWGVRLFETANTAEARRLARGTRRRFDRRRKRIKLLQEEFKNEINQVDINFFQTLKEFGLHEEDRSINDNKEFFKNYNKKYPTIYHLRKELIEETKQIDIRLVYLAIHHIIKYRGNFLYSQNNLDINEINITDKLKEIFEHLNEVCPEIILDEMIFENFDFNLLENILYEESKKDREIKLKNLLKVYFKKDFCLELTKLLIGNKFNVCKLFDIEDDKITISFKDSTYEDKYSELESLLENKIDILDELYDLYTALFLKSLFKGKETTSLSSFMFDKYIKHKEDLKKLKLIFTDNRDIYNKIFRTDKKIGERCLYEQYIHNIKLNKEIYTSEEFYKDILEYFKVINDDTKKELIEECKKEIDLDHFIPRITDTENGKYPYQLNKSDLIKIIENQGKYYPFLLNKIDDGSTYRILSLLEFRIPYYVGPLNDTTNSKEKNPNAWMICKGQKQIITPYNFNQVVDLESSAEIFIKRMISHCTYLLDEYALPNNSILYCEYKVRNELKQIKVNEERLSLDFQNKIFEELFLKNDKNITNKMFVDYLRYSGKYGNEELIITGYSADGKFANNMIPYFDFLGNEGIFAGTNYKLADAEEIIQWITIFEDKDILKSKVSANYSLSDQSIKKILGKKYKGWGNLSETLLTTKYYYDKSDSTYKSIMDLLKSTQANFMQIIFDEAYNFQKMIQENNNIQESNKIDYSSVNKLATSPANKKGIYQALQVVSEIVQYMGYNPNSISIEMARGDEEKKRKDTRKNDLIRKYDKHKSEINNYNKLVKELKNTNKIDSEKLFLYFIQEGKCLYTGTPLDVDNLEIYEVDHILPRSLIKDDSIENKALVIRSANQNKSDKLILPKEYRTDQNRSWWIHLKKVGLITLKKYNNLCRNFFSDEEINHFINRQLVETRQITKHVANILQSYYKKTEVIYLHANLSHNYRLKYELFKYRDLNDFHHAHDAYLAAVLGEYQKNYINNINFEQLREISQELHEKKLYSDLRYGYVINSIDKRVQTYHQKTGEIFDAEKFNKIVENTIYQNDIMVSRKTEIKTGEFYNQTKNSKNAKVNEKAIFPLKDNLDTKKYGSYGSSNCAYIILLNVIKKGKEKQIMIGIPIIIHEKAKNNSKIREEFIRNYLDISENDEVKIIKDYIPFNTLINYEGQSVRIKGYSLSKKGFELNNAMQLKLEKKLAQEWKYTLNYLFNNKNIPRKKDSDGKWIEDSIITDDEFNQQLNQIFIYLIEKIKKYYPLYKNVANSFGKFVFDEYDWDTKKYLILELFKLLHANASNANLKKIGLGEAAGRLNEKKIKHGKIIYQSVTGIKEKDYEF